MSLYDDITENDLGTAVLNISHTHTQVNTTLQSSLFFHDAMCCVGMNIFVNLIQELNKSNGQAMGKPEGNGDEAKDFIKG